MQAGPPSLPITTLPSTKHIFTSKFVHIFMQILNIYFLSISKFRWPRHQSYLLTMKHPLAKTINWDLRRLVESGIQIHFDNINYFKFFIYAILQRRYFRYVNELFKCIILYFLGRLQLRTIEQFWVWVTFLPCWFS